MLRKKRFKLYWVIADQKTLTPSKSTSNQTLNSQASNDLLTSSRAKLKPPKIPVAKVCTHNALKMPFLLFDKKHDCRLDY